MTEEEYTPEADRSLKVALVSMCILVAVVVVGVLTGILPA